MLKASDDNTKIAIIFFVLGAIPSWYFYNRSKKDQAELQKNIMKEVERREITKKATFGRTILFDQKRLDDKNIVIYLNLQNTGRRTTIEDIYVREGQHRNHKGAPILGEKNGDTLQYLEKGEKPPQKKYQFELFKKFPGHTAVILAIKVTDIPKGVHELYVNIMHSGIVEEIPITTKV